MKNQRGPNQVGASARRASRGAQRHRLEHWHGPRHPQEQDRLEKEVRRPEKREQAEERPDLIGGDETLAALLGDRLDDCAADGTSIGW
jgi:hypothetical protein